MSSDKKNRDYCYATNDEFLYIESILEGTTKLSSAEISFFLSFLYKIVPGTGCQVVFDILKLNYDHKIGKFNLRSLASEFDKAVLKVSAFPGDLIKMNSLFIYEAIVFDNITTELGKWVYVQKDSDDTYDSAKTSLKKFYKSCYNLLKECFMPIGNFTTARFGYSSELKDILDLGIQKIFRDVDDNIDSIIQYEVDYLVETALLKLAPTPTSLQMHYTQ